MKKILTNTYLSSFCAELAMLAQAGTAPYDSVMTLLADEPDRDGRAVLQSLLVYLEQGLPLSSALRESGYFSSYMSNLTEAGEKTGRLSETLKAMSGYYDRQERLSLAIKNAVLYPAVLLILMAVVVLILVVRVLPIFDSVYSQLGGQMPPLAAVLMRFGGWLAKFSTVIAVVTGLIAAVAAAAWMIPGVRSAISLALKNKLGNHGVFGQISSSRFIFVISLAVSSGIDPAGAAELAAAAAGGYRAADKKYGLCIEQLCSGRSLAEAMYGAGILSARSSRLLATGSRTGAEAEAMADIAARCERDTQDNIDRIVGKIEPVLVITASLAVGIILLTVMLPLMGIMTSIG